MSTVDELAKRLEATHTRQAEFQSVDRSTKFRFVCTDASPSKWILRQDGATMGSGIADTPEDARDQAVLAAKDFLGHDFICELD